MDELFAPPGVDWQPVSDRLATKIRLVGCVSAVVGAAVLVAVLAFLPLPDSLGWLPWLVTIAGVAAAVWCWWWAGRWRRAWGYAERDDDLYIKHGLMFRTIVAVPYGRMQFVDVLAGPLDRAYGMARVELHTASMQTRARILGLPADQAARMRDRLTERGEARAAGL
ncbi:MAG: PH domain-containing protein [Propionibacteriales bacterium]|nr:PH domain-containing protein [Propionibacteriales bacterium]